MAKISTISTGTPASTSKLVGNIGTTTYTFNVEDILGVPITAQGDLLIGDSSNMTTRLAIGSSGYILQSTGGVPVWKAATDSDPSTGHITTVGSSGEILQTTGNAAAWVATTAVLAETLGTVGDILIASSGGVEAKGAASSGAVLAYSTADGSIGPQWIVMDPGELLTQTSAAVTTVVAIPSSGAILAYSTADGSIGPAWVIGDPGGMFYVGAAGAISTLAIGSSGYVLQSTGSVPAWVAANSIGAMTTMTSGNIEYGSSAGARTSLAAPSSWGILAYSTVDTAIGPAWMVADPNELVLGTTVLALTTGEIPYGTSGGAIAALADPSSGAVLMYSTADGSLAPAWLNMTSGGIVYGAADATPTVLAAPGSSGAVLYTDGSSVPAWLSPGSSDEVLTMKSGLPSWEAAAGGGGAGGGTTAYFLRPADAHLPSGASSNAQAYLEVVTAAPADDPKPRFPQLVFSTADSTRIHAQWAFGMPANYSADPVIDIYYKAQSATAGNVQFGAYFWAISNGDSTDVDAHSFGDATTASTSVPATSGFMDVLSISMSSIDGAAAGDFVILDIYRDANDSTDTAAGDIEVPLVALRYTAV